jgi:hypothetical protein
MTSAQSLIVRSTLDRVVAGFSIFSAFTYLFFNLVQLSGLVALIVKSLNQGNTPSMAEYWYDFPIFLFQTAIFGLTIGGGLMMWKGRKQGYKILAIAQLPQIPVFLISGVLYSFSTGFRILVGYWGRAYFDIDLGKFKLLWDQTPRDAIAFAINLVALSIFIFLCIRLRQESQRRLT